MKWRILVALTATVVLAGAALGYVWFTRPAPATASTLSLAGPGLLVRSDGVLAVIGPDGTKRASNLRCARVYAAHGTGVCLREDVGAYQVTVLDADLKAKRSIPLNGLPNRARVSASGRMVSWTTFVTGDSYNGGQFATRSGILDARDGTLAGNLENFTVQEGRPNQDANFWGITFAADDNRFYATMSTGGHRYLMEGDFAARAMRQVKDNVECPSLSPDGTRIAYKKMLPDRTWRLTVLDLATLAETPLAETRSVDDQAAWLDGATIGYGVDKGVWAVPADGTGTPRLLAADAESPAAL
ncbi:TolB-like translocation protein; signal peptide [Longispora fulva]|uniref:Dipeptidyl aminopeptidase/acylaminoacyl peptidase n=1 Tax=Longispora fulva TaxID=619741 RepID=A0A8J7KXB9_9ACTN|nr:hypothetical protein [Longispora fulva]MBG6137627.1 dipeptidyl aminopeptidase/acylaminoacyl peptidase [Longispora fulva]GIG62215.1 TolB-like translocation protein; signal peptide [Longispora fulva]